MRDWVRDYITAQNLTDNLASHRCTAEIGPVHGDAGQGLFKGVARMKPVCVIHEKQPAAFLRDGIAKFVF